MQPHLRIEITQHNAARTRRKWGGTDVVKDWLLLERGALFVAKPARRRRGLLAIDLAFAHETWREEGWPSARVRLVSIFGDPPALVVLRFTPSPPGICSLGAMLGRALCQFLCIRQSEPSRGASRASCLSSALLFTWAAAAVDDLEGHGALPER